MRPAARRVPGVVGRRRGADSRLIQVVRRALRRHDRQHPGEADPEYAASDARRDISVLLDKLPDKQRTAIRLVKLEEKSVREASSLTGLSESDIKISIHRGLKTLMRLMAEEQPT